MKPLLIADGLIATTYLIRDLLRKAYGEDVEVLDSVQPHNFRPEVSRPIFISRLCHPGLSWFPGYLQSKEIPYVYFLDDNFFELLPEYDVTNASFFSHPAVQSSLTAYLENASLVWLMSKPLQDNLEARCKLREVYTGYGAVDIELFDKHVPVGAEADAQQRPIRVGYPTSRRMNVADLLTEIVHRSTDVFGEAVHYEFVGWCPEGILGLPNVTLFPAIRDYDEYVAFSQSRHWDIGLAPIGESLFENCKTSVKFREYGAARIPAIYSDAPLYSSSVVDGETGVLVANNANAWVMAIKRLIEQPEKRRQIGRNAYEFVRQHHEIGMVAEDLRKRVDPLFAK